MDDIKQIEWFDDYDLLKSFYTKDVLIFNKNKKYTVNVKLPTIKDLFDNDYLSIVMTFFQQPWEILKETFNWWNPKNTFDIFWLVYFELENVLEFVTFRKNCIKFLHFIFKDNSIDIDTKNQRFFVNNVMLDDILWEYVWYILWSSFGNDIKKPQVFNTPFEKEYFERMRQAEDRIKQIRSRGKSIDNNKSDGKNQLLKSFTVILYAFKQLDFDFLFNCTNAQINWLIDYAHRISNYEVEANIFAAGNSKEKRLKFFTEK